MKLLISILLALFVTAFPIVGLAALDKFNASELLASAQLTGASIVTLASNDPALREETASSKPFWKGIQDTVNGLQESLTSLDEQNDDFFAAIANVASGYAQAEVGRIMSGSNDERLADAMKNLGVMVAALYKNYSKEAARLKRGGELTQQEREALKALQSQQVELLKKLDEVEKKVGQNNEIINEGIATLRENSRRISDSASTVHGFVGSFFAAHFMYNWMWGWHWWWGPWGAWAPGFINININIWDDWIDTYTYDWALTEAYIDVAEYEQLEVDLDPMELGQVVENIEAADYALESTELSDLTAELDLGWDDVSTERGFEVLEDMSSNFDTGGLYGGGCPMGYL